MKLGRLDFVRLTYWVGAIVCVLAAVQYALPTSATLLGFPGQRPAGPAGQMALVGATLFAGWAAVLVWAHLRTRERRAVLAVAFFMVLGFIAGNLVYASIGILGWPATTPTIAVEAILAAMFGASFLIARAAARERGDG